MAIAALALTKITAMNTGITPAFSAITTGGASIPIGKDERVLLVALNANGATKTCVVTKGNDPLNGAPENLTLSIATTAYAAVELDSAKYGQMSGTSKGLILLTSDAGADVSVIAFQLY